MSLEDPSKNNTKLSTTTSIFDMKEVSNLQSLVARAPHEPLPYTIHDHSSYSGPYHPRNICVNEPTEQSSRHVCNLKEFKVYGGLSPDNMNELLHKGLTDDNKPELFPMRYTYNDVVKSFLFNISKSPPLATFAFGYVEVRGIKDNALMDKIYTTFNNYKEMETFRLCLKYFRQKNMMDVYSLLQKKVNMDLEHPLISNLHDAIVIQGDFKQAETILLKQINNRLLVIMLDMLPIHLFGKPVTALNNDGDAPSPRDGHQTCGPSARSCHSICFDPTRKSIYVLGKYIKAKPLSISSLADRPFYGYEADFYQYFIELDRWIKISENTMMDGGPALLCDHQTCIDPTTKTLYVIGGHVVTPDTMTPPYSAFYAFDMDECHWRVLKYDENHTLSLNSVSPIRTANWITPVDTSQFPVGRRRSSNGSFMPSSNASQAFRSRAGHSVLMDWIHQRIYILVDNVEEKLVEITHDFQKLFGSEAGYTQRASIDVERQEIYVYSAYLQTKPSHIIRNCLWVYYIQQNEWEKIYESDTQDTVYWQRQKDTKPYPRYAYQFIYNVKTRTHFYLLDILSSLTPNVLYLLRTRQLRELCLKSKDQDHSTVDVLTIFKRKCISCVNHEAIEALDEFKALCADVCLSVNTDE
ncbi:Muskelin N-terminus-domain-containing protein, partial [Choanephora cucurbitarum]